MEPKDLALTHSGGVNVPETKLNIVDALQGQQEQLKRLIAQKMWISNAPKSTLSEIKAQLGELKRLIVQLESDIRDQLKKRTGPPPMRLSDSEAQTMRPRLMTWLTRRSTNSVINRQRPKNAKSGSGGSLRGQGSDSKRTSRLP
jgi:hypothetical protein